MNHNRPPVPWKACILVFLVALVFRLGLVVYTDQIHEFPRKEMVRVAMTFAARGELGDPYAAPTGPTALVPPIYPIFLGYIFRIFGTGVGAEVVKCLITSTVSAFRCALMPWLVLCLGLRFRTAIIAGLLSAFYIGALATDIKGDWAEAWSALLVVGLFFVAIRISDSGDLNLRSAAVLGVWWGLTLLVSPPLISIMGSFVLVGAFRFLKESPAQYVKFVAVLGFVALVVLSPWPIRNQIVLGRPIWAKGNFGVMMHNSYHPDAKWDVWGVEDYIDKHTPTRRPEEALKVKAIGEVAYDKAALNEAIEWIRANPGASAELLVLRTVRFWFPPGANAIFVALEWAFTVLAMIGLYLLYYKHRPAALLILSVWLLYPPLYYIMLWSSRYRYPINWMMVLTVAVALNEAITLAQARRGMDLRGAQ